MQKLRERNTYTPTDIPHVRGNCDSRLKSPEGRGRAASLKTSFNNPDAALTGLETPGQDLRVLVAKVSIFKLNKERSAFLRQHEAIGFRR